METVRFELTHPKELIYSQPQLSHFAVSPNFYGRGTENRTLVNRLKAYYFATKLYLQTLPLLSVICLFVNKVANSDKRITVISGSVPRTVGPA